MRQLLLPVTLLVGCVALAPQAQADPPSCERVAKLVLPHTKIASAQTVAAGAFTPPPDLAPWLAGDPATYRRLPAFCRVVAEARPSAASSIKIEVWMPLEGWNGKFRAQGNGGFAGEIDYNALAI